MEWWKKEEVEKYRNKTVKYDESLWTIKEVFWKEVEEKFVYYLENDNKKSALVFEEQIELISA